MLEWICRADMYSSMPSSTDIVIIGAGMAGASLASVLAASRSVVIIEAEEVAGYHATGRSAAFWQESYGGVGVQPLTSASEQALAHPDADFSEISFLRPRGALVIGRQHEGGDVDDFQRRFARRGVPVERLSRNQLKSRAVGLRPEWSEAAEEPSCRDIDVAALHQAYLRDAKRKGARLVTGAKISSASFRNKMWHINTSAGTVTSPLVVNAAGAWADHVASLCGVQPIHIQPYRRTMVQLRLNAAVPASLPLIQHVNGEFYFKGEGPSRIWLSPHDETPCDPCDAAPTEWDVALAIERFQSVVDWPIAAVERKWAGLRSFAPDRLPVFGADPGCPSFIWCAGQGGFGIQTAPAISALLGFELGVAIADPAIAAVDAAAFSPQRFR
jgi:D-arginine dehydrogenase